MAVFLFTLHAYRSWMPNHKRGYVRRRQGILPTSEEAAQQYDEEAKQDRIVFSNDTCEQVINAVRDLCDKKDWRLHAIVAVWTHTHILASWKEFQDVKRARAVFKRSITTWLRDCEGNKRKWLSGGGSVKQVKNRAHFDYLMSQYLPKHQKYGGKQWYENEDNRS